MTKTMCAAVVTLALGLVACGDDDEPSAAAPATVKAAVAKPRTLAIVVTGTAKKSKITAPRSIPEGLTAVTLTQRATGKHNVQLVRIDEGHSLQEAVKAGDAWGEKPLPEWLHLEGGVTGDPDRPATAVQVLPAGRYVAFDFGPEDVGGKAPMTEFEVTPGDAGAEVPVPDAGARVEMKEYAFVPTGLKAGRQSVLVDNVGKEPHLIVGAPLRKGSTLADARKFLTSDSEKSSGPPPVDFDKGFDSGVLDGGKQQIVDFDLKAGSYVFVCFVPDRAGGPPHVAKGMVSEVKIG